MELFALPNYESWLRDLWIQKKLLGCNVHMSKGFLGKENVNPRGRL